MTSAPTSKRNPSRVKRRDLDVPGAEAAMRPADKNRFRKAMADYDARSLPLQVSVDRTEAGKWSSSFPGNDQEQLVAKVRLLSAFGTCSQAFIDTVMGELMTIWDGNGGISQKSYNSALAVVESAQPRNELEAMLVVQMIAANEAALRATAMVGKCEIFDHAMGFGSLANKLMRTFAAQTEALAKLRRGGEQVVRHVHVHEGGQAVVAGAIHQRGGSQNFESDEQPYRTTTAERGHALPSPDQAIDILPGASHAEREMQTSRREKPRSSEGQ